MVDDLLLSVGQDSEQGLAWSLVQHLSQASFMVLVGVVSSLDEGRILFSDYLCGRWQGSLHHRLLTKAVLSSLHYRPFHRAAYSVEGCLSNRVSEKDRE
jgi:hypothetical protein